LRAAEGINNLVELVANATYNFYTGWSVVPWLSISEYKQTSKPRQQRWIVKSAKLIAIYGSAAVDALAVKIAAVRQYHALEMIWTHHVVLKTTIFIQATAQNVRIQQQQQQRLHQPEGVKMTIIDDQQGYVADLSSQPHKAATHSIITSFFSSSSS